MLTKLSIFSWSWMCQNFPVFPNISWEFLVFPSISWEVSNLTQIWVATHSLRKKALQVHQTVRMNVNSCTADLKVWGSKSYRGWREAEHMLGCWGGWAWKQNTFENETLSFHANLSAHIIMQNWHTKTE